MLRATATARPIMQITVAIACSIQCSRKELKNLSKLTPRGKRTTKEPPRQIAWRITKAPTDPGRAVVARFAVPEMVGMEVEVVSVAVIFMKNVPVC